MIERLPLGSLLILCAAQITTPAAAIDGEIIITQTKALEGGITPGDEAGFPITLTQSGAYRFGSNITPPADLDGIEVMEADITINLNGFRLHGMGTARTGIRGWGTGDNIWKDVYPSLTVRNGTIAGFYSSGIAGGSHSWIVENMRITANGGDGILIVGKAPRIVQSTITANRFSGINCNDFCHVESSLISGNSLGVAMFSGTIISTTITDNKVKGLVCYSPLECVSVNSNIKK
jgi:hypothetical protein